jgi:cytochrome oxidase Cu insertion factor (SCO1/SenC/PrrC family)
MGRWLGTVAILFLLVVVGRPSPPGMRQGAEAGAARADVPGAVGKLGERLPDFELRQLDGTPLRLVDLRGHRVLLTFERSLDW